MTSCVLGGLSFGRSTSSAPVQRQMAAEETCTCNDHVAGESEACAGAMPTLQPGDKGAGEQEDRAVHGECVNGTDPALGAGQVRYVGGAGKSRGYGRQQAEPGQERCRTTRLGASGEIEQGRTQPAPGGHVGERRMHGVPERVRVEWAAPNAISHRPVCDVLSARNALGQTALANRAHEALRRGSRSHRLTVLPSAGARRRCRERRVRLCRDRSDESDTA